MKPDTMSTMRWVGLPSGIYVSSMVKLDETSLYFTTLSSVAEMDVDTFNEAAGSHGVRIERTDPPIDRLMKAAVYISRKKGDSSFVPSHGEIVDMLLEVEAAKARYDGMIGRGTPPPKALLAEPAAELYECLANFGSGYPFAAADILEFLARIGTGANKGKYMARRLAFDENFRLRPEGDDIMVAGTGYMEELDGTHKYPVSTRPYQCFIRRVGDATLVGSEAGFWNIGKEPTRGERRVVRHYTRSSLSPSIREGTFGASAALNRDDRKDCSNATVGARMFRRGKTA